MYRADMTVNIGVHPLSILLFILLCLRSQVAAACSCAGLGSPTEAAATARAVFEGQVSAVQPLADGSRRVTFAIVRTFKGTLGETVDVHVTGPVSSPCAVTLEPKASYLVYASGTQNALVVEPCTRTRPIEQAGTDLQDLGPGAVPVDASKAVAPALLGKHPPVSRPAASPGGCASCQLGPPNALPPSAPGLVGGLIGLALWARSKRGARKRTQSPGSFPGHRS